MVLETGDMLISHTASDKIVVRGYALIVKFDEKSDITSVCFQLRNYIEEDNSNQDSSDYIWLSTVSYYNFVQALNIGQTEPNSVVTLLRSNGKQYTISVINSFGENTGELAQILLA